MEPATSCSRARVRVSEGGRLVIPAEMRQRMGVKIGDTVMLELTEFELRVVSTPQGIRRAQAMMRPYLEGKPSMAGELIRERREEAERE